ncbi:MAG TPA: 30S ribosomal protein S4 [bacterium]|nr:30S ribosomal protein S4 [bacterium]
MRYTGPKKKLCRREGVNLFGSEKYDLSKGIRKTAGKFGKSSDSAQQLRSKQRAKRMYGLSEKQFASYFKKAVKSRGITGDTMFTLLEMRFDNVVFRSNLARTIMQARQFVNHAHFLVNGQKADIPSYALKVGDKITLREKLKESPLYKSFMAEFEEFKQNNSNGSVSAVRWIDVDVSSMTITVTGMPTKDDFDQAMDIARIVEFYSK